MNGGLIYPSEQPYRRNSKLATASLVCGVLGIGLLGTLGIPSIALGIAGHFVVHNSKGTLTGRWRATAGIVLGAIQTLVVCGIFLAASYASPHDTHLSKIRQTESDFKSFESALAMYKINARNYPTTEQGLEALEKRPETGPEPRRWSQIMTRLPKDPWGNSYRYQFPAPGNPEKPLISSNGPDGIAGTADDLSSTGE